MLFSGNLLFFIFHLVIFGSIIYIFQAYLGLTLFAFRKDMNSCRFNCYIIGIFLWFYYFILIMVHLCSGSFYPIGVPSCRPNFIYSILILGDTTYASRIYILQHWIKHIVAFYLCLKELSSYLHSTTTAAYFLVK